MKTQASIIRIIDPAVMSSKDVKGLFESLSAEDKLKLLQEVFASLQIELKTTILEQMLNSKNSVIKVIAMDADSSEMKAEWKAYIDSASDTQLADMMIALGERMAKKNSDRC
ncbi:MAG: hypothetical protein F6J93_30060 [Oscillatoria sp. SIO1A7]|nr:hypothetical protein [Oscillatoria sp. SIO1A7]